MLLLKKNDKHKKTGLECSGNILLLKSNQEKKRITIS